MFIQAQTDSFDKVMFLIKPLIILCQGMAACSSYASCLALAGYGQSQTTHAVAVDADLVVVVVAVVVGAAAAAGAAAVTRDVQEGMQR